MIVHVATATVVKVTTRLVTIATRRELVLLKLRKRRRSVHFEINIFLGCLMVENIFELLSVAALNIKDSASVILVAAHTLDILSDCLGKEPLQNVPNQADGIEGLLHGHLEGNAVFLPIEQTTSLHLFFMVA